MFWASHSVPCFDQHQLYVWIKCIFKTKFFTSCFYYIVLVTITPIAHMIWLTCLAFECSSLFMQLPNQTEVDQVIVWFPPYGVDVPYAMYHDIWYSASILITICISSGLLSIDNTFAVAHVRGLVTFDSTTGQSNLTINIFHQLKTFLWRQPTIESSYYLIIIIWLQSPQWSCLF